MKDREAEHAWWAIGTGFGVLGGSITVAKMITPSHSSYPFLVPEAVRAGVLHGEAGAGVTGRRGACTLGW